MENNKDMGNLSDMLEQILSTDEGKQAYEQLNQIFGESSGDFSGFSAFSGNSSSASQENFSTSGNSNSKSKGGFSGNPFGSSSGGNPFGGIDPEMMMKFGKIFAEIGKNDKNTQLLMALRPHLREENQHKIDNAMKISRLISLFPQIKDSGMFEGFF